MMFIGHVHYVYCIYVTYSWDIQTLIMHMCIRVKLGLVHPPPALSLED